MSQTKYFSGKLKATGVVLGNTVKINSSSFSLLCCLSQDLLQRSPIKVFPQLVKFTANQLRLDKFVQMNNHHQTGYSSQFCLYLEADTKKNTNRQMLSKIYRCVYEKNERRLNFVLCPNQQLQLSFHSVEKPLFAKTNKLQNLLSGQLKSEQSGIITMDQTGRMLVESLQCPFPAVGVWVQSKALHNACVYFTVCAFLKKKSTKQFTKLVSSLNHRNYIYFARIQQNQLPQLYLVSWNQEKSQSEEQSQVLITHQVNQNNQIMLQFNKKNLQFTLRGQNASRYKEPAEQILEFSSPRKQITNEQLQQQLEKLHLQQSPQFSSIKKCQDESLWAQTKTQLKQKVEMQQQQIQTLKRQVQYLKKQLRKARQNTDSPSSKPLHFFKSPNLVFNSSTPAEKNKKLSSSDLQLTENKMKVFQSGSTKQKNSMEQFSTSRSGSQENYAEDRRLRDPALGDQQPWDIYQIIQ